jgi:hypothetical protein
MPPRDFNDAKYWRDQASELRLMADNYLDDSAAEILRRLATDYDQLAERAQDRTNDDIDLPTPSDTPKEENS